MKKLIAILLLISLSFQCAVQLGVMVNFSLNQDFITRTLCINRAKPELKCNGKCHLAKSLNKTQDKQEQKNSKQNKVETSFQVFLASTFFVLPIFSKQVDEESLKDFFYQEPYFSSLSADFFHPPQA